MTRTQARWILLAMIAASAVIRFAHMDAFLEHVPAPTILTTLTNDTGTYLDITEGLATGGGLASVDEDRLLSRPPGYPLLALPFHVSDTLPGGILVLQTLCALCVPWFAYRTVRAAGGARGAGLAAAFVPAISPTNVSIAMFVIPDSIFTTLVALATWLLVRAWRRGTPRSTLAAGGALALGLLMKPALVTWWWLAPLLLASSRLFARRRVRPLALVLLALPQLVVLVGWSARNHADSDLFTYSTVGPKTIRMYTGVQIEEWNRLGRFPTKEEERTRRNELYDHFGGGVDSGELTMRALSETLHAENRAILGENPSRSIRALVRSARRIGFGRSGYHREQLPEDSGPFAIGERLSYVEWQMRRQIPLAVTVLALAAAVVAFRNRGTAAYRDRLAVAGMLLVIYAYFLAACSVTSNTGPRIVHPGEPALVCAVVLLFAIVADAARGRRTDAAPGRSTDADA